MTASGPCRVPGRASVGGLLCQRPAAHRSPPVPRRTPATALRRTPPRQSLPPPQGSCRSPALIRPAGLGTAAQPVWHVCGVARPGTVRSRSHRNNRIRSLPALAVTLGPSMTGRACCPPACEPRPAAASITRTPASPRREAVSGSRPGCDGVPDLSSRGRGTAAAPRDPRDPEPAGGSWRRCPHRDGGTSRAVPPRAR